MLGIGAVIMLLSLATCSRGVDLATLMEPYGPPITADRLAAKAAVERAAQTLRSAPSNRAVRLRLSEVEATSLLSLGLMLPEMMSAMETMTAEEAQGFRDLGELREEIRARAEIRRDSLGVLGDIGRMLNPEVRTGDVQVRFTEGGEVVVAGYLQAWRWQQPVFVVFAPSAREGELHLDFIEGRFGRLPAPERAFDLLGGLVTSLILQGREYAEITEISVEEGQLTFAGVAR